MIGALVLAAALSASVPSDKVGHFLISAAITSGVYALNATADAPRPARLWNAVMFPLALGIVWEIAAIRAGKSTEAATLADLQANALGIGFGVGIAFAFDLATTPKR